LIDWVTYDDEPPWPPEPDGGGPTLELIDPFADNALPQFWAASLAAHGTPGEQNSVHVSTGVRGAGANAGVPVELYLAPAAPNPFNPSTTLRFGVPRPGRVELRIFDAGGRVVRSLLNEQVPAGHHHLRWDGRNDQGRPVASAVYFYELRSAGERLHRKIVLIR